MKFCQEQNRLSGRCSGGGFRKEINRVRNRPPSDAAAAFTAAHPVMRASGNERRQQQL